MAVCAVSVGCDSNGSACMYTSVMSTHVYTCVTGALHAHRCGRYSIVYVCVACMYVVHELYVDGGVASVQAWSVNGVCICVVCGAFVLCVCG